MTEKLAENLMHHQKILEEYLNTNVWLNSLSLVVLVVAVYMLWLGYGMLKRIERQGVR